MNALDLVPRIRKCRSSDRDGPGAMDIGGGRPPA
jgi:hypothetical protein